MGKKSRDKGKVGEREVAEVLREHGWVARRGVQYAGGPDSPDVVAPSFPFHIEVKRTERFRLYPALEQAAEEAPEGAPPVVFHRPNHKPWVAVLRAEDLLDLLNSERYYRDWVKELLLEHEPAAFDALYGDQK